MVTSVESDLGFGENPRIHGVTPLVATVDRLEGGTIGLRPGRVRLTRLRSETFLLMRTTRGWRTGRLLNQTLRWAATRERFARVHLALSVGPTGGRPGLRLSWAPLWSERPTVLFRRQDTDKGTLLTFGHQDPDLGALRATTFRVFEDDGERSAWAKAEQFAVLDIGHRHVRGPQGDEREPDEHRQLRPHRIDRAAFHADVPNEGLEVVREEDGGNTLAGMLTAAADRPESGYAYTEMGDGGVRVMFEGGLTCRRPRPRSRRRSFSRSGWPSRRCPVERGCAWPRRTSSTRACPASSRHRRS